MNKRELTSRINEMMKDVTPWIKTECKRLAASGAIDFSNDDSRTYSAAKKILTVALENAAKQYTPFDETAHKEVKNLRHF
jgi:hypothetical protein